MSLHKIFCIAAVLAMAVPSFVNATPSFRSSVRILGGNEVSPGYYYTTDVAAGSFKFSDEVASTSGSVSFDGLDGDGNSATMTLDYTGQAQASTAGLRASVSGSLADAFYNATNDPYVVDASFNTDPNGVPTSLSVEATARFSDTLSIVGGSGLNNLAATISIDGTTQGKFSADNYVGGAVAQVYQTGDSFGYLWGSAFSESETSHSTTLSTSAYQVNSGTVDFGLMLTTRVDFNLDADYLTLESLYEGVSDFFNTVTVDSFAGYDVDGNAVDLVSVTGSGGQTYSTVRVEDTTNVPEPATLSLIGLGLAGFGFVRRKK